MHEKGHFKMPVLKKTSFVGTIRWLGRVRDRDATMRSSPARTLHATFQGIEGEAHSGWTRPSCARVAQQYPKGTIIRNTRQISVVSEEEMSEVADQIGASEFDPGWCGANIVVSGIPDFSHIPPSSRLQTEAGTTLTVDIENRPCQLPAQVIEEDLPNRGKAFRAAATGKRGVTAWVEREGMLTIGDVLHLHIPDQPIWSP